MVPGARPLWPARLWLALAATAVALGLAEVGLRARTAIENRNTFEAARRRPSAERLAGRVALGDLLRPSDDERIVYELRPGLEGVSFKGGRLSTSSLGFRSNEHPPEKDSAVVIAGLGDSIMFGHGVNDGEPYLAVLEALLRERFPARDWRVYNTAVPGYNTVIEVQTLLTKVLPLQPDLVILDVVLNDLELPVYLRSEVDPWFLGRSFLLELVRERLRGGRAPAADPLLPVPESIAAVVDPDQAVRDGFPPRFVAMIGLPAYLGALDELRLLSEQHGFEVLVFSLCEFSPPVPRLLDEARARGFTVLSLLPEMRAWMREHESRELSPETMPLSALTLGTENPHPSALTHRMAAERILAWMESSGQIERLAGAPGLGR